MDEKKIILAGKIPTQDEAKALKDIEDKFGAPQEVPLSDNPIMMEIQKLKHENAQFRQALGHFQQVLTHLDLSLYASMMVLQDKEYITQEQIEQKSKELVAERQKEAQQQAGMQAKGPTLSMSGHSEDEDHSGDEDPATGG